MVMTAVVLDRWNEFCWYGVFALEWGLGFNPDRCRTRQVRCNCLVGLGCLRGLNQKLFTSRLLCTNQSPFNCPSHLHRPYGCKTIAMLLINILLPSDPPSVLYPLQDIVSLESFIVEVNSPFVASPPLQSLPYCDTTAWPLRNIRPPPPFLCHTPYNSGDGNIV